MPTIIVPRVRRVQPTHFARVDWSNTLARGLTFLTVGGVPVDLVNWVQPDTNLSYTQPGTQGRLQVTATATPLVFPRQGRSRPLATGSFTMFVFGECLTLAQWPRIAQVRDNDNTSLVFLEQDNSVTYWGVRDNTPANYFPGYAGSFWNSSGVGKPFTTGITLRNNDFCHTYFNGKRLFTDTAFTLFSDASATTNITWANGNGLFGNYLTAVWNRTLADAEFTALHRNPWQLMRNEATETFFSLPSTAHIFNYTPDLWHVLHNPR